MLHGFLASVAGELATFRARLAQFNNVRTHYTHRFFVAGRRSVDARWRSLETVSSAAWRFGQGVYALRFNKPSDFSEGKSKPSLWEFNDPTTLTLAGRYSYDLGTSKAAGPQDGKR